MDYTLMLANFSRSQHTAGWPRQRLLHECLRAAIRSGQLAPGTLLLASRALAVELGVARNTVLYAYDQLATEGYVRPDRRGTVVSTMRVPAERQAAPLLQAKLSRRAQHPRPAGTDSTHAGAFAPGVPALDESPMAPAPRPGPGARRRRANSITARRLATPQLRGAIAHCDAG